MKESYMERKLKKAVEERGGLALKLVSSNFAGIPDRLVLLPNGKVIFVEMKAPGKKLRPLQLKRKKQLEALGFTVLCVDSIVDINVMIKELF